MSSLERQSTSSSNAQGRGFESGRFRCFVPNVRENWFVKVGNLGQERLYAEFMRRVTNLIFGGQSPWLSGLACRWFNNADREVEGSNLNLGSLKKKAYMGCIPFVEYIQNLTELKQKALKKG